MVGSLTLPENQHIKPGSVSLSSPNHSKLSTYLELNQTFCSLYPCPSSLVVSFCRGPSTAPTLGLFPLAKTFPLCCRPKTELIPAVREVQREGVLSPSCVSSQDIQAGDCLLGSSQDPRLLHANPGKRVWAKFLAEGMPLSPPAPLHPDCFIP